jgi:hypothetical protein
MSLIETLRVSLAILLDVIDVCLTLDYANPDLVHHYYEKYKTMKFELDQLRKKRNEHANV